MANLTKRNRKIRETLKAVLSNAGTLMLIVAACTIVIAIIMNWKGVVAELSRFFKILMPFIIGLVLAFLINPLVSNIKDILNRLFFKERHAKACKYTSVALAYVFVLGLITIAIVYIVPQVSESVKELMKSLKNWYNTLMYDTDTMRIRYPYLPVDEIMYFVKTALPENIFNYGPDVAKVVFPYIYNLSASFVSGLINVIFSIVISCYLILDKEKIVKAIRRIIFAFNDKENASDIWNVFRQCNHIFNGFLYGKTIDSLIIGMISLIVMSLIGLPYALLLSVIVGVTNMIPYFGPFIGAVPGVIIYLVIEPKYAIIYVVMILIIQQFDGLYLGPRILGDLTGIKPLWVIFGITVGGAYFGVIGMFLGVPSVAVIVYIIDVLMKKKLKKQLEMKYREK